MHTGCQCPIILQHNHALEQEPPNFGAPGTDSMETGFSADRRVRGFSMLPAGSPGRGFACLCGLAADMPQTGASPWIRGWLETPVLGNLLNAQHFGLIALLPVFSQLYIKA